MSCYYKMGQSAIDRYSKTDGVLKEGVPENRKCEKCNEEFIVYIGRKTIKGISPVQTRCKICTKKDLDKMLKEWKIRNW